MNAAAQPSFASAPPTLADLTDGEVQRDFDTKVLGYLRCARAVAPHMTAQGQGRIVNISAWPAAQCALRSGPWVTNEGPQFRGASSPRKKTSGLASPSACAP
ncbi:SDR family NAD(P)-dependent oxidoreductase [Actinomadura madurae]